jgi:hypothetical protein
LAEIGWLQLDDVDLGLRQMSAICGPLVHLQGERRHYCASEGDGGYSKP